MKKINKRNEPQSLTDFKNSFPMLKYENLTPGYEQVRIDIRNSCIGEQFFLCAYCCNRITISDSHNDHIIPQSDTIGANLTLNYENIVASCQASNHCGHKKGEHKISVTPLMDCCESDIIYQLNGKMTHRNPNAQSTINILNLRDRGLNNKRKNIIDLILFQYVEDLNNMVLEDPEYLKMIIDEISQVDQHGKLEAFSPVIINVLRQFLS